MNPADRSALLERKIRRGRLGALANIAISMIYSHYNQLTASDAARALMAAPRDGE